MKITNREKRDWSLLIVIVPIGIFLMMIAGQIAVRIVPNWSVQAGMQSSLNLDSASKLHAGLIQPILPDILTPESWLDTFLTPSANLNVNVVFPPFIVFDPSATPSATASAVPSATPTAPAVTATPSPTIAVTSSAPPTKKPPSDDPPAPTATTPAPVTSTPEGTLLTPVPSPQYNNGTPDNNVAGIPNGKYVKLTLPTPIIVTGPTETNYDFVYYERATGSGPTLGIDMDSVILSISKDNINYYVVFNWGNNQTNDNGSINLASLPAKPQDPGAPPGTLCTSAECDNQHINANDLYQDPSAPSSPDTGILVDVDNAPSHPPPGSYQFLAIQAPASPPNDGNDGADVDSVQVTEVPSP